MSEIKNQNWGNPPSKGTIDLPKSRRLYQVWKGRNKFLCGGRLIFGPDAASLFLSTFLIGGPAITFCIKMLLKITETEPLYGHTVLIVGCVLTIMDLTFLFLTSGRNPGIVMRNSRPPEIDEASISNTPSMEWVHSATLNLKLPRTKDLMVNGHTVKVKYCDTCLLYRPPRASHCSICNNCVERFDHHCPWVGQCIGITTYENFRYRYDKKENPYNDGIMKNLKEILFSNTAPSSINFREWVVEDDDPIVGSINQKFGRGMRGSKENVDLEMGGMLSKDDGIPLPNILRNLDYGGIDDDLKKKKKEGDENMLDPFFFPTKQEQSDSDCTFTNNGHSTTANDKTN
ncbi:hypothetical protein RHGRI_010743 [Rhododendron griersonianum]|uniref:S-acyltransferase n=1 Tax=Rhododendron griersonianum TaxID=479676 RepID=A0AAV6KJJ5_9ERIC|nr:hypothetical protein RHGRI_010743 [Rhododendron griersonianum]